MLSSGDYNSGRAFCTAAKRCLKDQGGNQFTLKDGERRDRLEVFVWQTGQGYFLGVLTQSSLNITVLWFYTKF